ncbi:hypothetical protein MMC24_001018 [Lignoscripta atroalba]|nr:hypothetical protein [Lignoscripta atroalba]
MASIRAKHNSKPVEIEPTEIYHANLDSTSNIELRVATGGAGQSGLLRALGDAFVLHKVNNLQYKPFAVAWHASDTSASFNHLAQNIADVSITYHAAAEQIAILQGIADRREYAWRDHWMLVGPKSNPAKLHADANTTIYDLFIQLFCAAIDTASSKDPIRFLSRYDKSAANIKESSIWTAIGQTPWSHPYSTWYHRSVDFPFKALKVAAQLDEYTLTDRGTWCSVEEWIREKMAVFKAGGDSEDDPLINPAHALVGTYGKNKATANEFVDWLVSADGGQEIIRTYSADNNGSVLYSLAPSQFKTCEGTNND